MAQNLISISDYAKLCGVTRAAIYFRLNNDLIKAQTASNGRYDALVIDTDVYPPQKLRVGRKPFKVK